MTLLHLITRLSLGGSAQNTIDSAAAATRAGYRTILATGPSGDEVDVSDAARLTGCEVVFIPSLRRRVSPYHDIKALFQIIRLIHRERVQIVHTHTSKAGFIGRLAAFLTRVPLVIHTPHGHIFHGYYGFATSQFFIALERLASKLTDRIVVLTERGADEHLARKIGRREQYVAIPSGVNLQSLRSNIPPTRMRARQQLGWENERFYLIGVGRLVPVKGFDIALRALPEIIAEVPNVQLVLVGDGPEREKLERLAYAAGLADRFTIEWQEVALRLAAADVLLAPSRNEGMGRAIVEALSLGVPVVASNVGGIPNVVLDGECGQLVPPDDPAELAKAVIDLLQDPNRRAEYGKKGARQAECFSLERMESQLLSLYQELAEEKGLQGGVQ